MIQVIEPSVKEIHWDNTRKGIYKHCELIGRVSHRSEGYISEDSCYAFIERMQNLKHLSVLNHGIMYLTFSPSEVASTLSLNERTLLHNISHSEYSHFCYDAATRITYVTANLRTLFQEAEKLNIDNFSFLFDLCKDFVEGKHTKYYTFEIHTSIAVTREGNRHTSKEFFVLEESTRYVNYSKKGEGDIKVNYPTLIKESGISASQLQEMFIGDYEDFIPLKVGIWQRSIEDANIAYKQLIEANTAPQYARGILPLDTATKVYYTASEKAWERFIDLRDTQAAHPDIRLIAQEIRKHLRK